MKINSTHVTFTLEKENWHFPVSGQQIPQEFIAKYLRVYLDRRNTWKTHISTVRKQFGLKFQQLYSILGRKSELSVENKLVLHKTILMTYGIPCWSSDSNSNIEILQLLQNSKI